MRVGAGYTGAHSILFGTEVQSRTTPTTSATRGLVDDSSAAAWTAADSHSWVAPVRPVRHTSVSSPSSDGAPCGPVPVERTPSVVIKSRAAAESARRDES